ncbi:UNVERIFIED_CONTAM: hypothetical protein FKN15_030897 [Acipenser sinensis]
MKRTRDLIGTGQSQGQQQAFSSSAAAHSPASSAFILSGGQRGPVLKLAQVTRGMRLVASPL